MRSCIREVTLVKQNLEILHRICAVSSQMFFRFQIFFLRLLEAADMWQTTFSAQTVDCLLPFAISTGSFCCMRVSTYNNFFFDGDGGNILVH